MSMDGQNVRFLTSAEKKTTLGKRSRFDERLEGDPSAFLSVIIDGNCFQVGLLEQSLRIDCELMPGATLVPGQVCVQWPRGRRRSCDNFDSHHRPMVVQMGL